MDQTSFKVWSGESPFNGKPISAILTNIYRKSKNVKIGDMLQLWILSSELSPVKARALPEGDESVCGDCCLKPSNAASFKESCYVARRAFQAPGQVWRHNMGLEVDMRSALDRVRQIGKPIRYGGYGDAAMIPQDVFESILSAVQESRGKKTHTAYTHQHNSSFAGWIKDFAMASTHSLEESEEMWDRGWRTFRITDGPNASQHEIICPAFTKGLTCDNCCLCDGKRGCADNRKSITIPRH